MLIADIIQEENFSISALKYTSEAGHKMLTFYWQLLKYIQLMETVICRSEARMAKMYNPISIHMLCSYLVHTTAVQDVHNLWIRDVILTMHAFHMITCHI